MRTNRIESLCDGIFAIVMTLLILELHVPVLGKKDAAVLLTSEILAMWPKFICYAVTFAVLGVLWTFHHRQLDLVAICDGPFIWLNILFFTCVSLLPFSTALLGEYRDLPVAILFYGGNLFVACMLLLAQLSYATTKQRLVEERLDRSIVTRLKTVYSWVAVAVVGAVLLSFINPRISLFVFALLSVGLVAFQVSRKVVDPVEHREC